MSKKKESGLDYFYRVVVPKVTSVGAALVVVGALFKIQHWPFAGEMLTVGLLTEAFLFLMGAFQPAAPAEAHYDWEKVYPELAAEAKAAQTKVVEKKDDTKSVAALASIDKMLAEASLSSDVFKSFGTGMKSLTTTVSQIKDITGVTVASEEYAKNLQSASKSVSDLSKVYTTTATLMTEVGTASKNTKDFYDKLGVFSTNLEALNSIYSNELKDANSHIKAMNKFYSTLAVAMESMSDASKESQQFKTQMTQLTSNLTTLNKVYGNMLTAMKG